MRYWGFCGLPKKSRKTKKDKKGISLFIELIPSPEGGFYDVKTGMVTRDAYYKNKKPLWEHHQSG